MGVAIVLNGCDFSAKNLGKVTFLQEAEVTGISIIGDSSITGLSTTYSASYLPANTNQRSCTWSIVSGSEYASIDSATGVLTIKPAAATTQQVTIKATSTYNSAITATKTASVTYKETVDSLTGISITGPDTAGLAGAQYSIAYNPANTSKTGVIWSITSGGSYASIDQNGNLTVTSTGSVTIKAVSKHDSTIVATKAVSVNNTISIPCIYFSKAEATSLKTGKLTDIIVSDIATSELEICFKTGSSHNSSFGVGSRSSSTASDMFCIAYSGKEKKMNGMFGSAQTGNVGSIGTGNVVIAKLNSTGLTLNDTLYPFTSTPSYVENTCQVGFPNVYNKASSSWQFSLGTTSVYLAYIKIKENGVLTHNLQPYISGAVVGLKDEVTGNVYDAASLDSTLSVTYVDNINA